MSSFRMFLHLGLTKSAMPVFAARFVSPYIQVFLFFMLKTAVFNS